LYDPAVFRTLPGGNRLDLVLTAVLYVSTAAYLAITGDGIFATIWGLLSIVEIRNRYVWYVRLSGTGDTPDSIEVM
jgi:hypothetical protein